MATKSVVTGDRYYRIDGKLLEIKRQLRQEGGYPYDLDRLERTLQDAIEGRFATVFDLDVLPVCLEGLTIVSHEKGGLFAWNRNRVRLHFAVESGAGRIDGSEFLKRSASVSAFNATLLDGLLGRPELIPDEWKGVNVFFPNTVYCTPGGIPCIRFLSHNGEVWGQGEGFVELGHDEFNDLDALLVRAST